MKDPEFDRALDSIDIETYLDREGIDYRLSYGTRGLQLNLRECPACHEAGHKTYINAESGLGNCFHGACGQKFNRFWLLKHVSGLSGDTFVDYVKGVAQQQGWMPKKDRPELVRAALALPSKTHPLPISGCNLAYLQERGVILDSCKEFELAYCGKGSWWKYNLADGTEKFMSFGERVLIPVRDLAGELVSFQGRDITGEQMPKYQFPVGHAVAGSHLYHGHAFKDGKHSHAVVGEGAFDAIAIHQAMQGLSTFAGNLAVATFGMHLSGGPDGQIAKFVQLQGRGLSAVTFMWDGEAKAIGMAIKAGLELMGYGLKVYIAVLPPGHDPAQGPDKKPTPVAVVRSALLNATLLSRLSAVKLLSSVKVSHR